VIEAFQRAGVNVADVPSEISELVRRALGFGGCGAGSGRVRGTGVGADGGGVSSGAGEFIRVRSVNEAF